MSPFLCYSAEVELAVNERMPLVALESTIISHGLPFPQNLEIACQIESEVRNNGAVPATIAIINGQLKVGLSSAELEYFAANARNVRKCSTRDIGIVLASKSLGSTTVASTMHIAHISGIKFFATGGIGGVHRNAHMTMDISADLQELAHTAVAVITAGPKAILDIGLTLEYLETLGVPVIGYDTDTMPAFYSRCSGHPLEYREEDLTKIVEYVFHHWACGLKSGVVIANPIPEQYELNKDLMEAKIRAALLLADEQAVKGKDITPFLLQRLFEDTAGESLEANKALVLNNAKVAAKLAVEWGRVMP